MNVTEHLQGWTDRHILQYEFSSAVWYIYCAKLVNYIYMNMVHLLHIFNCAHVVKLFIL